MLRIVIKHYAREELKKVLPSNHRDVFKGDIGRAVWAHERIHAELPGFAHQGPYVSGKAQHESFAVLAEERGFRIPCGLYAVEGATSGRSQASGHASGKLREWAELFVRGEVQNPGQETDPFTLDSLR
jgi:hypothetical protein